jgi:hypothetical protein
MHRTILIASVVMGLVVFASDVTARNHAVADAEVSKALADIRRASMESDIDALSGFSPMITRSSMPLGVWFPSTR